MVEKLLDWTSGDLSSGFSSAVNYLCEFGQVFNFSRP